MELEAKALCRVVREKLFISKIIMAIDVHSGFGARDRFWFPHSRAQDVFSGISEVMAIRQLFNNTYPNHFYDIEPTSYQYTIDGDLWDYLSDEFYDLKAANKVGSKIFVPWTLEMGSWIWLKKNPLQMFNKLGLFHPMVSHQHQRILRRHLTLFNFLQKIVVSSDSWLEIKEEDKKRFNKQARGMWYD